MQDNILASLTRLSDAELIGQLKSLVVRERDTNAELVAHLAELDTREVHLREGYASLYVYCRDFIGLSEWESYNRIEVARAARRFPVILEQLARGEVSLTTVRLLAPHLTSENHRDVLAAARGKRKAEVAELVTRLSPSPDVPCSARRVPSRPAGGLPERPAGVAKGSSDGLSALDPVQASDADTASETASALEPLPSLDEVRTRPAPSPVPCAPNPSPISRAAATPLSTDRYRFQVTIGGDTLEKIRLAKDMLGHAIPSGDDAAILDRAFTALLTELAKRKFADTPKPGSSRPGGLGDRTVSAAIGKPAAMAMPVARTPSAAVKRAVWLRDLGRCAFIGTSGHRCNERRFVEFHHVDPYALGGEATVEGIQLRCRRHNDYEGRLYFGNRRPGRELVPEQVRLSVSRSTA